MADFTARIHFPPDPIDPSHTALLLSFIERGVPFGVSLVTLYESLFQAAGWSESHTDAVLEALEDAHLVFVDDDLTVFTVE